MQKKSIKNFTMTAMLMAIMFVMGFTPLGSIPLPFMKATTTHIPVILAAMLFGWKTGVLFGVGFGVISVIRSTVMPNATSFAFSPFIPIPGTDSGSWRAIIVAFVPRICIALVVFAVYKLLKTKLSLKACGLACGIAGSLTNTVLVLGMIYLLLGNEYASAMSIGFDFLLTMLCGVVVTNGIGEAITAAVITAVLVPLLDKFVEKQN